MEHITPTEFIESLDSAEFTTFLKEVNNSTAELLSITLPITGIDPLAALELNNDYQEKFYWNHPSEEISISAAGKIRELKSTGKRRFEDIADQTASLKESIDAYTVTQHLMAGPLLLGGYSFNDHNVGAVWKKFGAARFVLPEWMLIEIGDLHLLTLTFEKNNVTVDEIYQEVIARLTRFLNMSGKLTHSQHASEGSGTILCTLQTPDEKENWIRKVNRAKSFISHHTFEKIVLARSLTVESKQQFKPTLLAHGLRQKYPDCYNFLIQKDEHTSFVGATPERLATFRDGKLQTEGLAGSASRGSSALEDASLAQSLMSSEKDLSEHQFVVRSIRDSLKQLSTEVTNPNNPRVKKLNNVQHLFTPIEAKIKNGVQIHDLIRELHPTPAVGGYPKSEAFPHIHEIEQIDRGWYAAPVGWFNLNGCGEFAVGIRSALLHKNKAELFAGCGIVADSDPEKEWNETLLKFRPLIDALNMPGENHA
jgi:menaquinone-specific isochorismate synthase